jgi:hypothetical protein
MLSTKTRVLFGSAMTFMQNQGTWLFKGDSAKLALAKQFYVEDFFRVSENSK